MKKHTCISHFQLQYLQSLELFCTPLLSDIKNFTLSWTIFNLITFGWVLLIVFEIPFSDGQAEAKRLAKSITSKTSNLKKQLKKYNSSVEILNQKGHSSFKLLTWEEASDVSSIIYSINFPDDDQFPLVLKRATVDAHTLVTRCDEETQYLKEEMFTAGKQPFYIEIIRAM